MAAATPSASRTDATRSPSGAAPGAVSASPIQAFVARGTLVPFTTPTLYLARLRVDTVGTLEAMLPAFSGSEGTYIIPFKTLPTIVTLTVHDRALFGAIVDRRATSPDDLHAAALHVARTGLAGPKAAETAAKALEREREEFALTKAALIARAVDQAAEGKAEVRVSAADVIAPGGRERASALLRTLAPGARGSAADVLALLDEWGALIGPIGIRGMGRSCRLRRLTLAVGELGGQLERWAEDDVTPDGEAALEVAKLARKVARTGAEFIARLDDLTNRVATVAAEWDNWRDEIRMLANSASWILDGWDCHVLCWRDAAERGRSLQSDAIHEVRAAYPRKVVAAMQPAVDTNVRVVGRGSVRAGQTWRANGTDTDLRRRLERMKERVL